MPNHQKSWLRWLQTIAPIVPTRSWSYALSTDVCDGCGFHQCVCRQYTNMESLAEALGIAAPWGPGGFVCEDEDCDGKNCVTKRSFRLETRAKNLEAVIRMLLSTNDPMEYSNSDQQAARRTATFFLDNNE